MKLYNPSKPLISIHVPRCGGTSLNRVLRRWFGKNFYGHWYNEKTGSMPKRHDLRSRWFPQRYKKRICIHGHFNHRRGFGVQHYYPEVDQFITVFRDPFDVLLSNYFLGKKLGNDRFREGKRSPWADQFEKLVQFLQQSTKSYFPSFLPTDITMDNYKEILEERFVYIGITEDLQTTVDTLAEQLGFQSIKINKLNASGEQDEKVLENARERFIENNPLSYAVYNYAHEHYKTP